MGITSGITASSYTDEAVKEHREQWVAALRSGQYQQTKQKLNDGVGYCCLGVACELSGITRKKHEEYDETTWFYDDEYLVLPTSVQNWLGVDDTNPVLDMPPSVYLHPQDDEASHARDVASLNDEGFTFDQIADLIEYFGFIDPNN